MAGASPSLRLVTAVRTYVRVPTCPPSGPIYLSILNIEFACTSTRFGRVASPPPSGSGSFTASALSSVHENAPTPAPYPTSLGASLSRSWTARPFTLPRRRNWRWTARGDWPVMVTLAGPRFLHGCEWDCRGERSLETSGRESELAPNHNVMRGRARPQRESWSNSACGSSYSALSAILALERRKASSNDRAAFEGDSADGTSITADPCRSGSCRGAPLPPRTTAMLGSRSSRKCSNSPLLASNRVLLETESSIARGASKVHALNKSAKGTSAPSIVMRAPRIASE